MTEYALYLESGPRRRKTMVHVLDLLGCIAQGPTTEDALAATPAAIRAYLRFLAGHGEAAAPEAPFTTVVAAHITEGNWLANGDPISGFAPDFAPLDAGDLPRYRRHLAWMRADLLALIHDLPRERLDTEPPGGGRPVARILDHIAAASGVYLRYLVGAVPGLAAALRAVEEGPLDRPAALRAVWELEDARLAILSPAELAISVPHGQLTWTARRALRRLLEHDWEHLQELSTRLAAPPA